MKIDLDKIIKYLKRRLQVQALSPRYVLSPFKIGNEDYRLSAEYTDPTNIPFYFYLGKAVPQAENLLEIGFESGLESGCFLLGCRHIKNFLAFHRQRQQTYWSPRLARANILNIIRRKFDFWDGSISDPEFLKKFLGKKWDVVLIDKIEEKETTRKYLDLVWGQMAFGGLIVVDRVTSLKESQSAYQEFCQAMHLPETILKTRYGIGLLVK